MQDDRRSISFPWFDSKAMIDQAFDRLIFRPWGCAEGAWSPVVDVTETDDAYLITVEVPGVPPEAIQIRAEDSLLIISGERQSVRVSHSGQAVQLERCQGKFSRSVSLGAPVDGAGLTVSSEHGVLYARLPKAKQTH